MFLCVFDMDAPRRMDAHNVKQDDSMRDDIQSNTRRADEEITSYDYDSLAYSDSFAPPNSIVNGSEISSGISITGSFGLENNVPLDKAGTWKTSNRKDETSSAQETTAENELHQHPAMYIDGEAIVVSAPPGKLGFVIESPPNKAPMVQLVRETSVLTDRIQNGDYLISLDRQDTTGMSATFLSEIIKSKENNPKREMVFFRPSSPLDKLYLEAKLNQIRSKSEE